jgi:hypothetical protein
MVSLPGSAFANLNSADLRSTRRFSEFANGIVLWRHPELGVLVREELELQETLRRAAERAGSRANAFSTTPDITDALCGELTRAGLALRRADPRLRLSAVISDQNRWYRGQMANREPVAGQSAA